MPAGAAHVDIHRLDQFRVLGGAGDFDPVFDAVQQPVENRGIAPLLMGPGGDVLQLALESVDLVAFQIAQAAQAVAYRPAGGVRRCRQSAAF